MSEPAAALREVQLLVPARGSVELGEVLTQLAAVPTATPFAEDTTEFVAEFSRGLSRAGRGLPELEALAFWMRRSAIRQLRDQHRGLESDRLLLVPRGTVFHIPPANVDTLFVYSWLLAILVGNRTIVRLSTRVTDQSTLILKVLAELLLEHPGVGQRTAMLAYAHDERTTAAISLASDVRVIWGGDATIEAIRRIALPPHATELTFPDRFSMAAMDVAAYRRLSAQARALLAERFFNDAYWFDQLGCSSARLVIWVGDPSLVPEANADFFERVRAVLDAKGYAVDAATAVAKHVHAYGSMIDTPVVGYEVLGNELTVLPVSEFPQVRGDFCGGGLFYSMQASTLLDLVEHIDRRDQTLAWFGFSPEQLRLFARALNGRGIDRIVPVGTALNFDRVWDGHDLLQAFTRRVVIDPTAPLPA
ncbi:MAG: gamma-glutamyl phosphate reductase [Actinomycetales bacterium]|nr:MAG: gamma-glutamyl phosphate reductase [Actinomycetales bacterium]